MTTKRGVLLPPYLSSNPAWQQLVEAIDEVWKDKIDDPIAMLARLRDNWILKTEDNITDVIDERGILDSEAAFKSHDRETLIRQANQLGFLFKQTDLLSDADYRRIVRNLGMYWYGKGTPKFIDFLSFCLGSALEVVSLWSTAGSQYGTYGPMLEEGDPGIGTPVSEFEKKLVPLLSGSAEPVTHIGGIWGLGVNCERVGNTNAPDGTPTAVVYRSNAVGWAYITRAMVLEPSRDYELHMWVKRMSPAPNMTGYVTVDTDTNNDPADVERMTWSIADLPPTWTKKIVKFRTGLAGHEVTSHIYPIADWDVGTEIAIAAPQLYKVDHTAIRGQWFQTSHVNLKADPSRFPSASAELTKLIALFNALANFDLVLNTVVYEPELHIHPPGEATAVVSMAYPMVDVEPSHASNMRWNFLNDKAVDKRIEYSGGANGTRWNSEGNLVKTTRRNIILRSHKLHESFYWTTGRDLGNFWESDAFPTVVPGIGPVEATQFTALGTPSVLFARQLQAFPAQDYVASIYIMVPSGQGITTWAFGVDMQDTEAGWSPDSPVFDQWVRVSTVVRTTAVRNFIDLNFSVQPAAGGVPWSGVKFYATGVQFEEGFARTDLIETLANPVSVQDMRLDYDPVTHAALGLLIEETRYNAVQNSVGRGATVGANSFPTLWAAAGVPNGVAQSLTGRGVEYGMPYVEFNFQGTPTISGSTGIYCERMPGGSAAKGQVWTGSVYLKYVGAPTGAPNINITVQERNSALVSTGAASGPGVPPTSGFPLRFTATRTLVNDDTDRLYLGVMFNYTTGVDVNVTVRVYLPQLEMGGAATSPILTSNGGVTRTKDVAKISGIQDSDWFNKEEGTFIVEASRSSVGKPDGDLFMLGIEDDSAADNSNMLLLGTALGSNDTLYDVTSTDGPSQFSRTEPGVKERRRYAIAYKDGDFGACSGGGVVQSGGAGLKVPVNLDVMAFGCRPGYGYVGHLNGHIRSVTYVPYRVSNNGIRAATAP